MCLAVWDEWIEWDLNLVMGEEGGDQYTLGADVVGENFWSAYLW